MLSGHFCRCGGYKGNTILRHATAAEATSLHVQRSTRRVRRWSPQSALLPTPMVVGVAGLIALQWKKPQDSGAAPAARGRSCVSRWLVRQRQLRINRTPISLVLLLLLLPLMVLLLELVVVLLPPLLLLLLMILLALLLMLLLLQRHYLG